MEKKYIGSKWKEVNAKQLYQLSDSMDITEKCGSKCEY